MKQIKRPLVCFVIYWTLGLIGGTLYVEDIQGWPLFCILIGILAIGTYYYYGKKQLYRWGISFLCGVMLFVYHPTTRSIGKLIEDTPITLQGTVQETQATDYGQNVILRDVTTGEANKKLYGKVQVSLSQDVFIGERLQVIGKVKVFPSAMNPSDFDYGLYLKGQNVVGVIKGEVANHLGGHTNLFVKLRNYLSQTLNEIFKGEDEGIMSAALIGEDQVLVEETQEIYSSVGIGHILCVSGFHVALVVSFLLGIAAYIGLSYTRRYIFVIIGIWCYAGLTGLATSTVRASIMTTVVMVARMIWEEEDFWTSMALSMLCILVWRPYNLWSMGFQLSFGAVGAIGISQVYLAKWGKNMRGFKKRHLQAVVPWLSITLLTSPIIAFHFYEVPFLSSVLNLLVLPLFSLIIILGWCVLGVALLGLPIIWPLVKGITVLLQGVHFLCEMANRLPLGTICTGRPTCLVLVVYYGLLILIGCKIYGMVLSKKIYRISGGVIGMILGIILLTPKLLQVTYLYVGQGDAAVIRTPHKQFIIIDGGPFGKGEVLMRYIKSEGKKEVAAVMVSHSDSDHIGGIIDLVASDMRIKRIIISKVDASEHLETLLKMCQQKAIEIVTVDASDGFQIDEVKFHILAPHIDQGDINDNSLVCLTTYKNFKALFTGDKSKESESHIYNDIGPISVLKVSHHGSKTGTEEKLLLKLRPQYAMISCGKNNLYNHPHKEVVTALETCEVPYKRTDLQGAIWVESDGEKMALYTQKQSEDEAGGKEE